MDKIEEKINLLFVLRQAKEALENKMEDLKIEIENEIKLKKLPEQLKHALGTARLENRPTYDIRQLAIRDALLQGFITYDDLYEKNCLSFRGGEIFKHFPEFADRHEHGSLVVKLEKLDNEQTISVLCQCPKYWREEK